MALVRAQVFREDDHVVVYAPFKAGGLAVCVPVDEDVDWFQRRLPDVRPHLAHIHFHVPVVLATVNEDVVLVVDFWRVLLRAENLIPVVFLGDLPAAQPVALPMAAAIVASARCPM